jgi:AraC-like DNA-binding protein
MNIETYIPSPVLSPYIRRYRIIESSEERVNRILPDTSFTLALLFRGQVNYIKGGSSVRLPFPVISGLQKTARLINYINHSATVIIQFKETGPAAFFKLPLHELFEQSVSLGHFIPQTKISVIEEQLAEAQNNRQRITLVERFLLSLLAPGPSDAMVEAAVRSIYAAKGFLKVKELASHFCLSQDAFEKRFRKTAGTSPKQFSSIVRMKSVIGSMRQKQPLTDITFDNGFFDQPHFNKEFRLFTGQTPTEFLRSIPLW